MKTYTTILLAGLIMATSTAFAADAPAKSSNSLELVLDCDSVAFYTTTNISIQVTFRNVGETSMKIIIMLDSLSVVWDGKEYRRNGYRDPEIGPEDFTPMSMKRRSFLLSYFIIPASAQTSGKHTLAVRDASAESNTLTVFIKTKQ